MLKKENEEANATIIYGRKLEERRSKFAINSQEVH
jgi:hypothetical protein